MKKSVMVLALALVFLGAYSQESSPSSDTLRKDALNVYFSSASSFIKREITFINYVRDLKEADVYIIATYEPTGSGGESYTFFIVGQNRCTGMNDTIRVTASPDETEDIIRTKQVNALKMGLMRYMLKTPLASYFDVRFTQPVKETVETDKWNNWVFRTNISGNLSGQKRFKSLSLNGSTSAFRVTEKSKFQTYLSLSWSRQKFEMNDSTIEHSHSKSQGINTYYVKSVNDHWSVGFSTGLSASSFGSYDLRYRLTPAIEYDIFPYSESTRRQLRIMYEAGYNYNDYSDTTIYNKLTEHLWLHELTASWQVVQKWGSVDFTLSWLNYFHDWSKNNLSASLYMSIRIFKGLNLNFMGSAAIVNDQLSLPKGGVSDTDILLRRRITETKFDYYGYFGFSYTFGSIYNNAVNPRFGW
ncbi:MAG: hypothetical protein IQL11_08065 [Bacteroidales bacterium]|nr:hypothetical protein [Bacteroidales bacterium]